MKRLVAAASLLFAVMIGTEAMAQGRMNRRRDNHAMRIQQGIRQGDLTRREASALRMREARIRGMVQMAKADGMITPRERMMIRKAKQRADMAIYAKRHNAEVRR